VREWAARLAEITCGGAALLVLLLYAPKLQAPFLVPKLAALELTASLGLVSFALARAGGSRAAPQGPRWALSVSAGALLVLGTSAIAWAAATRGSLGAPYALDAMARWGSLLGLACAASVIADLPERRQRVLETVTVTAAVVAAVGLLQHLDLAPLSIPVISTPGSTFGNRNLAAEVMAMALPLGMGAVAGARTQGSRWVLLASLALEVVFLGVTRARGAWLGAACGLVLAMWLERKRLNRTVLAVAVPASVVAAIAAAVPGRFTPRDAGDAKRYSGVVEVLQEGVDARSTALRTRLGLWRRSLAMVRDHPLLGVGPGNWPVAFPPYAEPGATRDGVLSASRAPRQAHDDLLERAAETGLPGLLALGALAAGTVMAARRRLRSDDAGTRLAAAAAAGALLALVGLSFGSFPLEMPGTLALGGLALGFVAADVGPFVAAAQSSPLPGSQPPPIRAPIRAYAALVAAGMLVPFVAVRAAQKVRGSAWLGAAERAMRRDHGEPGAAEALGDLRQALAVHPGDFRAELRTAQMLLRERSPIDSARAAERALVVEPYSPNAWAALAAAELAADDAVVARRDATHALTLLEDYPFALDVRARCADHAGDAVAASMDRRRIAELASGPADDDTARAARALGPAPSEPPAKRDP
jgi:O-antigen ligase